MPKAKKESNRKVPAEIRDELYGLWKQGGYTLADLMEYLAGKRKPKYDQDGKLTGYEGYTITVSTLSRYLQDESIRRETAADLNLVKSKIPQMVLELDSEISRHKADADDIWRKMPDYDKVSLKAYTVKQQAAHKAMELKIKLLQLMLPQGAPVEDPAFAKGELEEKLGILDNTKSEDG